MNDYLAMFVPVLLWYGLSIASGWLARVLGASPLEWFLIPFLGLPLIAGAVSVLSSKRRPRRRDRDSDGTDKDSQTD